MPIEEVVQRWATDSHELRCMDDAQASGLEHFCAHEHAGVNGRCFMPYGGVGRGARRLPHAGSVACDATQYNSRTISEATAGLRAESRAVIPRRLRHRPLLAGSVSPPALPEADARVSSAPAPATGRNLERRRRAGASWMALNSMGDHHGSHRQCSSSRAVEQGQDRRPEGTLQAEGDLGAARASSNGRPGARTRALQPRHRQQAAGLRPRGATGARRVPRGPGRRARHRHAAQDPAPRSSTLPSRF